MDGKFNCQVNNECFSKENPCDNFVKKTETLI